MKTFQMAPTAWSAVQRRMVLLFVIVGVVGTGIALGVNWANRLADLDWQNPEAVDSILSALIPSIVAIVLIGAVMLYTARRNLRIQRAIWESIRVEVGGNFVARSQSNIPRLIIQRDEITEIQETKGALCIRTANRSRSLNIPRTLEGYDEIKTTLAEWAPFRQIEQRARLMNWGTGIGLALAFGTLFFVQNIWLVLIVGVALLVYYGYFYWQLAHSEGVDPRLRQNMRFGIGFIAFVFLVKVVGLVFMMPVEH